ncbi:hypothetical protein [Haloarcula litorea]|uniref:hypothetical protein n=1 Tax=Haloarcula litorea TaxID=3032579 RepID=UPI0023E7D050|nr:hypothetical protein [Halomicroarcula sp. GDY20]
MDDDELRRLRDHLAATGERPVERTASRWLGEAEAVARDAAAAGVAPEVRRERVEQVRELLDEVGETGDEVADEHVAAAEALVGDLLADGEG